MKKLIRNFLIISLVAASIFTVNAEVIEPVHWEVSVDKTNKDEAVIQFKAIIEEPWHIYAQDPNGGLNPTTFSFETSENYELIDSVIDPNGFIRKHDDVLDVDYNLYSNEAVFKQKIKLNNKKSFSIKGVISYFSCDDQRCLPPVDEEFEIKIGESGSESQKGLFALFIISFLGGLGALLTPCVYPIIPLTVSFFMRSAGQNKNKSVRTGIIFSLSIIFIYTSLGLVMGLLRINLINVVASSWLANAVFFLVFLLFAFSFYGMFELVLPSKWSNSVDAKADKGGIAGTFFMALATVLISFSCTGPIIGGLIFKSLQGEVIKPIVGMFAFSLAFSLPFPLLAMFPNMIKSMPKSGGWMNSVKVGFAFIMIAFSMIFLLNIDKLLHWNFITREVFIAIWMVLSFLLGLYFLGKIKFSHDSDIAYISVPRFMLALISFVFAVILFTGLFGADLKGLSAILPEKKTINLSTLLPAEQNTKTNETLISESSKNFICGEVKYADFLHLPHGLSGYFDIQEGLACAKEQNKPVFFDFKGHVCKNCKEMEQKVWSDPRVLQRLKDNYIIIGLFTDDRTKLPEEEWYKSSVDGKVKKTLGKQNLDYQILHFGTNSIPFYVLVDHNGNKLVEPKGYDLDVEAFINFLDEGVTKFNQTNKAVFKPLF